MSRAFVARQTMPLLKPSSFSPVASDFPYIVSMHSWERPFASTCTIPSEGRYCSHTSPCGTTAPVSTLDRPTSSCHSPLTPIWPAHDLTGPAPKQESPDGHSAAVAHGASLLEQVRGTEGFAGWSALFTTRSVSVTRTCTSGVGSWRQPA
jgi:hypothetical protein